jgi:hypothetical protein
MIEKIRSATTNPILTGLLPHPLPLLSWGKRNNNLSLRILAPLLRKRSWGEVKVKKGLSTCILLI